MKTHLLRRNIIWKALMVLFLLSFINQTYSQKADSICIQKSFMQLVSLIEKDGYLATNIPLQKNALSFEGRISKPTLTEKGLTIFTNSKPKFNNKVSFDIDKPIPVGFSIIPNNIDKISLFGDMIERADKKKFFYIMLTPKKESFMFNVLGDINLIDYLVPNRKGNTPVVFDLPIIWLAFESETNAKMSVEIIQNLISCYK